VSPLAPYARLNVSKKTATLIVVVATSFLKYRSGDHRDLHSFPTRRSSDLGQQLPPDGRIDLRREAGAVHAAVQLQPGVQRFAQVGLLKVLQMPVVVYDRPQVMLADQLQFTGLEPALEQH